MPDESEKGFKGRSKSFPRESKQTRKQTKIVSSTSLSPNIDLRKMKCKIPKLKPLQKDFSCESSCGMRLMTIYANNTLILLQKNTEIRQRNILSEQYDLVDQETHLLKPIPKSKPIDEYNLSLVTIYVESCESDSIFTVETIFRTI